MLARFGNLLSYFVLQQNYPEIGPDDHFPQLELKMLSSIIIHKDKI